MDSQTHHYSSSMHMDSQTHSHHTETTPTCWAKRVREGDVNTHTHTHIHMYTHTHAHTHIHTRTHLVTHSLFLREHPVLRAGPRRPSFGGCPSEDGWRDCSVQKSSRHETR